MAEAEREVGKGEKYACYCGVGFPTKILGRNHRRKDQCMVWTVTKDTLKHHHPHILSFSNLVNFCCLEDGLGPPEKQQQFMVCRG